MPGFCVNCGSQVAGAFCTKCGTPAQNASAASPSSSAAPPAASPVPAAAAKGSGAGKVLLIVGGVFIVLFAFGIAGILYGVHVIKHKVSGYSSAVTGSSGNVVQVANGNTCKLLSTSDLQQILGVQVERSSEIMDGDTPGCAYYTNQAAFAQLQKMSAQLAKKQADEVNNKPGPKPNDLVSLMKNANQMEGAVKALGLTEAPADGQVFSFTVQTDAGKDAWAGMRLVQAAVPGFEEVSGVGDRAMIGAFGHAFYLQKGDTILYLNTMWVPDARTRGIELGKKILSGM